MHTKVPLGAEITLLGPTSYAVVDDLPLNSTFPSGGRDDIDCTVCGVSDFHIRLTIIAKQSMQWYSKDPSTASSGPFDEEQVQFLCDLCMGTSSASNIKDYAQFATREDRMVIEVTNYAANTIIIGQRQLSEKLDRILDLLVNPSA